MKSKKNIFSSNIKNKTKRKVINKQKTAKVIPIKEKQSRIASSTKENLEEIDPREKYMTIGDHLEELRLRIFAIIGIWVFFSLLAGIFSPEIHKFLVQPFKKFSSQPLILGTIYGPLEVYFKLSILVGFFVSLPFIFTILWGYITPALSKKASIIGHIVVFASSLLFWIGIYFAWQYLFPLSLNMMLNYFLPEEAIAQTSIEKYYSFLFLILIGSGATFQLPLLVILLGAMGVVTVEWHKKIWKYVVVIIFIFSAIITPPDPFSLFVLAIPLLFLYFFSVSIVWFIEYSRKIKYKYYDK